MEEKKTHPSLPPNYVTLAQLQERWLKEKERQQREKEQQEQEEQKLQQQKLEEDRQRQNKLERQPRLVNRMRGDGVRSGTRNRKAKQLQPEIKNISDNNRSAVKASCENREKLKDKAEVGDQNAEQKQDSKSKKSKKKWNRTNRKPRAEKEVTGITDGNIEVTMEGDKAVENTNLIKGKEKEEIKSEVNDKNDGLAEEVEEKIGDLSINGGKGKENGRFWRPYTGFRGPHRNSGGGLHRNPGVGGRYGDYDYRPYRGGRYEYGPHPGRLGYRVARKYRDDDYGRYRRGRYEYGTHPGRLGNQAARKYRDDKMIWVKKGESSEVNVGGTEIASDS